MFRRSHASGPASGAAVGSAFRAAAGLAACCGVWLAATGCAAKPDRNLTDMVYKGDLGKARAYLQDPKARIDDKANRNYMLQKMRTAVVCLGDGYALPTDTSANDMYQVLRTQGINADKTVASVALNENVRVWKGEPFEQALACHYIALAYGSQASWDNMRSAGTAALFPLRDFGTNAKGERASSEDLIIKAQKEGDKTLDQGYVVRDTNFTLAYLMTAIANQQMYLAGSDSARQQEAADYFRKARGLSPELAPVIGRLERGDYNTILVVDYGQGPQKTGTGPDNAIAKFVPVVKSDGGALSVVAGADRQDVPIACDVNAMAADHMWNNLEDVRIAKSTIGSVLVGAGAGATAYGAVAGNRDVAYAGLAMMVLGAVAKSQAFADTRYCEVVPQRVYVVPLNVQSAGQTVELQVAGAPVSRMVLTGLAPPASGKAAALRYVRLVSSGPGAPAWATSGKVLYPNDYSPEPSLAGGPHLPYILGGDDVRTPTEAVLKSYQSQGLLAGMTLSDLVQLYKQEGIALTPQDQGGVPGLHVLEGGKSLVAPLPGTTGYARLFCQQHAPYQPASPGAQQAAARARGELKSKGAVLAAATVK